MILAFSGKKHCGKDTAANFIMESKPELKFKVVKFADPLKDAVCAMFDLTRDDLESLKDEIESITGVNFRYIQQTLGTEWGRDLIHPDIWVLLTKSKILKYQNEGYIVLVTDVRFDNEADLIKNLGGALIETRRMTGKNLNDGHTSEKGVDEKYIDYFVMNNDTIESFKEKMLSILEIELENLTSTFN
jgi:hypothetical protein